MKRNLHAVFSKLIRKTYEKAFAGPLKPLAKGEQAAMSKLIEESTGLKVSGKTLNRYCKAVLNNQLGNLNPSPAVLDILVRYVEDAPRSNELERYEAGESIWWNRFIQDNQQKPPTWRRWLMAIFTIGALCLAGGVLWYWLNRVEAFVEPFTDLSEEGLRSRGWTVLEKEPHSWERREECPGYLTLFTHEGDLWVKAHETISVKNMLVRPLPKFGDYRVTLTVVDFHPFELAQQAGFALLEDTLHKDHSLRISLPSNGIYFPPHEKLNYFFQVIPYRKGIVDNRYYFFHSPLETGTNFGAHERVHLRMERRGSSYRCYYKDSEPGSQWKLIKTAIRLPWLKPRYLGIFAFSGFTNYIGEPFNAPAIPAYIDEIRIEPLD